MKEATDEKALKVPSGAAQDEWWRLVTASTLGAKTTLTLLGVNLAMGSS